MRKKIHFLNIFIVLAVCLSFISGVKAASSYVDTTIAVAQKKAALVCEYKTTGEDNDAVRIYYYPVNGDFQSWRTGNFWQVFVNFSENEKMFEIIGESTNLGSKTSGLFGDVFGSHRISYNKVGDRMTDETKFYCPPYAYLDKGGLLDYQELCLSDTANACGDVGKFDRNRMELTQNKDSIFGQINNAVVNEINSINVNDVISNGFNVDELIDNAENKVKSDFFSSGNQYSQFVSNYVDNIKKSNNKEIYDTAQKKADDLLIIAEEMHENGELSDEQFQNVQNSASILQSSFAYKKIEYKDLRECKSLLTKDVTTILKNLFDLIKYAGPILVAIMTIVDLVKASTSGDDGEMKKVYQKLVKRLIAAALLFFIPVIVNVIFDLIGITAPSACFL